MLKVILFTLPVIFTYFSFSVANMNKTNHLGSEIDSLMNTYGYTINDSKYVKVKDFYIIHSILFSNETFSNDDFFNFSEICLPDTTNINNIKLSAYDKNEDSLKMFVYIVTFNNSINSIEFYKHLESYSSKDWFYMTKDKQIYFLKDKFIVFVRSDTINNKYANPIANKLIQDIK